MPAAVQNTITVVITADAAKAKAHIAELAALLDSLGKGSKATVSLPKLVPPPPAPGTPAAEAAKGLGTAGRRVIPLQVVADTKQAEEKIIHVIGPPGGRRVPATVALDTHTADAKLAETRGPIGGRLIPLRVTADTHTADAKLAETRGPIGGRLIPLRVTADTTAANRSLAELERHAADVRRRLDLIASVRAPASLGMRAGGWLSGLFGGSPMASMRGALGMLPGLLGAVGSAGTIAFGAIAGAVRMAAKLVSGAFSLAVTGAKVLLGGLAAAAGLAVAGVYAAVKALQPAAAKEMAVAKWETLLGSLDAAKKRFKELEEFNLATPFETPEIMAAATQMQVFGFYSIKNLTAIGDAAAAMQRRIEDAVAPLARLRSGMFHQEMMAPIGITREVLGREGIKFGKSGELLSGGKEAFDAAIRYFERRFGGMAAKMATTWTGIVSNLKDAWTRAWANLGEGPLVRLKGTLQEVFALVNDTGERLKGFDLPWLDNLTTGVHALRNLMADLADANKRAALTGLAMGAVKAIPGYLFGETVKPAGGGPADTKPGVMQALAAGLGKLFGNFVENFGGMLGLFGNAFMLAWRYGVALFKEAWRAVSAEAKDRLAHSAALPGSPVRATWQAVTKEATEATAKQFGSRKEGARTSETMAVRAWLGTLRENVDMMSPEAMRAAMYERGGAKVLEGGGLDPEWVLAAIEQGFRQRMGWETKAAPVSSEAEAGALKGTLAGLAAEAKTLGKGIMAGVVDAVREKMPEVPAAMGAAGDEAVKRFGAAEHKAPPMERMLGTEKDADAARKWRERGLAAPEPEADKVKTAFEKVASAAETLADKLGMPKDFEALAAMTPRQRQRMRRQADDDAELKEKMERLAAGKSVHFSRAEKRRIEEAGGILPASDREREENRLRKRGGVGLHMQEHVLGSDPVRMMSRDPRATRIQGLAANRIDMKPGPPPTDQPTTQAQFLLHLRKLDQLDFIREAIQRMAGMEAIA